MYFPNMEAIHIFRCFAEHPVDSGDSNLLGKGLSFSSRVLVSGNTLHLISVDCIVSPLNKEFRSVSLLLLTA